MRLAPDLKVLASENVDEHGTWAISYGDMITLLLTFFILFFNTDSRKTHYRQLQNSLQKAIEGTSSGQSAGQAVRLDIGKTTGTSIDETVAQQLGATVTRVGRFLVIDFPGVSFFEFGKVDLSREGIESLQKFVKTYQPYAGNFTLGVRAFTDHKPVKQNGVHRFQDNLELSALRSVSAMRLLQNEGIPLKKMRVSGYGETDVRNLLQDKLGDKDQGRKARGEPLARKVILTVEPALKDAI